MKLSNIRIILFSGAVVFFLGWIVGFFLLGAGMMIHTLVAMAMIFCIQGIIVTPRKPAEAPKINA